MEIKANVRKGTGLVYPDTSAYLEFDIYLPSLKLAFEYQVRTFALADVIS